MICGVAFSFQVTSMPQLSPDQASPVAGCSTDITMNCADPDNSTAAFLDAEESNSMMRNNPPSNLSTQNTDDPPEIDNNVQEMLREEAAAVPSEDSISNVIDMLSSATLADQLKAEKIAEDKSNESDDEAQEDHADADPSGSRNDESQAGDGVVLEAGDVVTAGCSNGGAVPKTSHSSGSSLRSQTSYFNPSPAHGSSSVHTSGPLSADDALFPVASASTCLPMPCHAVSSMAQSDSSTSAKLRRVSSDYCVASALKCQPVNSPCDSKPSMGAASRSESDTNHAQQSCNHSHTGMASPSDISSIPSVHFTNTSDVNAICSNRSRSLSDDMYMLDHNELLQTDVSTASASHGNETIACQCVTTNQNEETTPYEYASANQQSKSNTNKILNISSDSRAERSHCTCNEQCACKKQPGIT